MKKILFYLNAILDEAIKEMNNKLGLAPVAIAAIISGAITVGTKISEDQKAKKAAKKADIEAEEERLENERKSKEAIEIARSTARQGDPTLAAKQRAIKESAANTVGQAVATSGSTQEIIKAASTVQGNVDRANIAAESQAGQVKLGLRQQLASRFSEAGRLRLGGEIGIDRRLQNAVNAIGANAQANTDTVQNLGKQVTDVIAFKDGYPVNDPYNINIRRGPGTV